MKSTELDLRTKERFDRIAPLYDLLELLMEWLAFRGWRKRLWNKVSGNRVLEVGVGTGRNFDFYPPDAAVIAIDISPKMIKRAQVAAKRKRLSVELLCMDAQYLAFKSGVFDSVAASSVFCSVPDPVQGLREVLRVCQPEGRVTLLEHMRANGLVGWVLDWLNPVVVRFSGVNVNRRTLKNVRKAGLRMIEVENLFFDVVRLIEATPSPF